MSGLLILGGCALIVLGVLLLAGVAEGIRRGEAALVDASRLLDTARWLVALGVLAQSIGQFGRGWL